MYSRIEGEEITMDQECPTKPLSTLEEDSQKINRKLSENGLYGGAKRETHEEQNSTWRISPEPFFIEQSLFDELSTLGNHLQKFYVACCRLYELSVRGRQPEWVRFYLETGKPETVIEYGQMRRFRKDIPLIIRPDILLTDDGFVASELDSIPGGFGLLGALSAIYSDLGYQLIGGRDGMVEGFGQAIRDSSQKDNPTLAIVVSEESNDYLPEMKWLEPELTKRGLSTVTVRPEEIHFQEDGLYVQRGDSFLKIDVLYRFFELFDLKNIPKIDLILYAVRKQLVTVTPPLKSYLEEKSLFALFHHLALQDFWLQELGEETFWRLKKIFPQSWILDPRPIPPHATIPGLEINGKPVNEWAKLKDATKRDRELVCKVSGFSETAWGSKGVGIGHDMSASDWAEFLDNALESFYQTPFILQKFHKGTRVHSRYFDFAAKKIKEMDGRVRLCPYYYVQNDKVELSGVLATICPLDKKLIHGMVDAVMVPTAVRSKR